MGSIPTVSSCRENDSADRVRMRNKLECCSSSGIRTLQRIRHLHAQLSRCSKTLPFGYRMFLHGKRDDPCRLNGLQTFSRDNRTAAVVRTLIDFAASVEATVQTMPLSIALCSSCVLLVTRNRMPAAPWAFRTKAISRFRWPARYAPVHDAEWH